MLAGAERQRLAISKGWVKQGSGAQVTAPSASSEQQDDVTGGNVKGFFTLTFKKGNMCYDDSKCATVKGISLQSGLRRSCPLRGPHLSVYVSRSEARKRIES